MLLFTIAGCIILYIGNFLGIVMLSYQLPSLKPVRHLAGVIPFLQIRFLFNILITPREGKIQYVLTYIFGLKHKNVIFAECLAIVLEEYMERHPHASYRNMRKAVRGVPTQAIFNSIGDLVMAV